ncbi:hypothetical protein ACIPVK_07215 [Paeniglutamicibacter sp. MACA_103]|uniref:hypothetical protein n=1 Tax=Paeniglutamicibacter sp. MACA_103 TaxID=3377337 RepID=UPI0038940857
MTSSQPGLFEVQLDAELVPQRLDEMLISEEQIAWLRRAFDEAQISDMSERRELIQGCMIRPIETIRQLYAREFNVVMRRIASSGKSDAPMTGSTWDNREEDTWIDKL